MIRSYLAAEGERDRDEADEGEVNWGERTRDRCHEGRHRHYDRYGGEHHVDSHTAHRTNEDRREDLRQVRSCGKVK